MSAPSIPACTALSCSGRAPFQAHSSPGPHGPAHCSLRQPNPHRGPHSTPPALPIHTRALARLPLSRTPSVTHRVSTRPRARRALDCRALEVPSAVDQLTRSVDSQTSAVEKAALKTDLVLGYPSVEKFDPDLPAPLQAQFDPGATVGLLVLLAAGIFYTQVASRVRVGSGALWDPPPQDDRPEETQASEELNEDRADLDQLLTRPREPSRAAIKAAEAQSQRWLAIVGSLVLVVGSVVFIAANQEGPAALTSPRAGEYDEVQALLRTGGGGAGGEVRVEDWLGDYSKYRDARQTDPSVAARLAAQAEAIQAANKERYREAGGDVDPTMCFFDCPPSKVQDPSSIAE